MRCFPSMTFGWLAVVSPALAQSPCAEWSPDFSAPGVNGGVSSLHVLDIGGVDKLVATGSIDSAGTAAVDNLAFWDGQAWQGSPTPLGDGVIYDFASFDDGTGPKTYAAGHFVTTTGTLNIAVWDGTNLFDVGGGVVATSAISPPVLYDLEVFDDGSGPALYVGGRFDQIGNIAVNGIARWDGTSWSAVGSPATFPSSSWIGSMAVFDDGSGPALYAGGSFTAGGTIGALARWDGTSWSQVGAGLAPSAGSPTVDDVTVHDDGGGSALYAIGSFQTANGLATGLARWDGTSWSAVGTPPAGIRRRLFSWGSTLVADGIAFWDGSAWTVPASLPLWGTATAMAEYDDGTGPALYVGGSFPFVGGENVARIAKFDGTSYLPLVQGNGAPKIVDALAVFDDGSGPKIAADVRYDPAIYQVEHEGVSLYDGTGWTALGGTTSGGFIETLESYDDGLGNGPMLYAGGDFTSFDGIPMGPLARWNGTSWGAVGGFVEGRLRGMEVWDDGSGEKLAVCGVLHAVNGVPMSNVSVWDGQTWTPLGVQTSFDKRVNDLAVFDDGTGPALYAGGLFEFADGQPAGRVARWDGATWQPVGSGMDDWVHELAVHDDGTGPALYAGGRFGFADGQPADGVARWDGTAWSPVGGGLPDTVKTLEVVDLGFGPVLFAGGQVGASWWAEAFLHYLDGADWVPYERPIEGRTVLAIAAWDDPTTFGPDAFVSGQFERCGGVPSVNVGQLSVSCPCDPPTYCTAKQNSLGCFPAISTSGSNSLAASDLSIDAAQVLNNRLGILIWSRAANDAPFQGGFLCVGAPFTRTPVQSSGGNPPPDDCSGTLSFAFDAPYAASRGLVAGDVVHAQYWSRDAQSQGGSSLSDAVQVLLCP